MYVLQKNAQLQASMVGLLAKRRKVFLKMIDPFLVNMFVQKLF